jgi:hypothetical protein
MFKNIVLIKEKRTTLNIPLSPHSQQNNTIRNNKDAELEHLRTYNIQTKSQQV